MQLSIVTHVGLCLTVLFPAAQAAHSQSFQATSLVDDQTPRPDGIGYFSPSHPSISGATVVFNQGDLCAGCAASDSIWAVDLGSKQIRKLVGTDTPVPGGKGTFRSFDSGPLVKNGMVVFIGFNANSRPGLYAVPSAGGDVVRLVDASTPVPGAAAFPGSKTNFRSFAHNGFQHDGATAVFAGSGTGVTGVYSVHLDGSSLTRIADSNTPINSNTCDLFPVKTFSKPSISNGHVAFLGEASYDYSAGFSALYTSPVTRSATSTCPGPAPSAASSLEELPGNPGAHYQSYIDYGRMDGTTLFFRAVDNPAGFGGIFALQTAAPGGPATRIADSGTTLPVLGNVPYLGNFTFAADAGNVIFHASGFAGTASALFLAAGGAVGRIAGTGDSIEGQLLLAVDPPGAGAVEGSAVAFTGTRANTSRALYLAKPAEVPVTPSAPPEAAPLPR